MNNGETIVIDLTARYAAAFGITAISNKINQAVITKEDNDYNFDFYGNFNKAFDEVSFEYDGETLNFWEALNGDNSGVFAPPLMLNFSREKKLIETEINGSENVVVERWGTKPWQIDIRGILIDLENRWYPEEKISQLNKFFEHNDIIKTIGTQFFDKGIDSMYLKSVSITPVEGFADTVRFSLSARSIKEITYNLINPL